MNEFQVLILVDAGIGNAIQALYGVEYCLHNNIKVGIFLNKVNKSFQNYLVECYGDKIILDSLKGVTTRHLLHSFTFQEKIDVKFQYYFYLQPDFHSSAILSETGQYLSVLKALFPSDYYSDTLTFLKENNSESVQKTNVEKKTVIYPGGSSFMPARRWPHYEELIKKTGEDNIITIGGNDDINFSFSYVYPKFLTSILPQALLNQRKIWLFLKKVGLLKAYAHFPGLETRSNSYINKFSWAELVALLRKSKNFIGNDGGLSHLAGAAGANGFILFGPTSSLKNKPISSKIKVYEKQYNCQPCQFGVGKVMMTKNFVNCPFQIRCMSSITAEEITKLAK